MAMGPTDEVTDLIRRARQGDPEALGRLLDSHRERLRQIADRQLRGRIAVRMDASDVVQQTFLEVQRGIGRFEGDDASTLAAWLERVLQNAVARTIRDHALLQKRDVRRERPLEAVPHSGSGLQPAPAAHMTTPSQQAIRGEEADRLSVALAQLPPDQQQAVRLRHLEGRSLAEISRYFGRSESATAGLIKRGMEALRTALRQPSA